MKNFLFVPMIIATCLSAAAGAEETQRYSLQRTTDGYVRTDTSTGKTSVCIENGDQLVCRMAADDRQAYETDIAALEAKIDSLEMRISALEKSNPSGPTPKQPVENEMEFQTSLNRMEQFFRRFMGIVKEFQAFGGDNAPSPDRT
jgi:hypothetical protein